MVYATLYHPLSWIETFRTISTVKSLFAGRDDYKASRPTLGRLTHLVTRVKQVNVVSPHLVAKRDGSWRGEFDSSQHTNRADFEFKLNFVHYAYIILTNHNPSATRRPMGRRQPLWRGAVWGTRHRLVTRCCLVTRRHLVMQCDGWCGAISAV